MKENIKQLCEIIIEKDGNISTQDVFSCGYTIEHFIRIAQPNITSERLVKSARKMLAEMEKRNDKKNNME